MKPYLYLLSAVLLFGSKNSSLNRRVSPTLRLSEESLAGYHAFGKFDANGTAVPLPKRRGAAPVTASPELFHSIPWDDPGEFTFHWISVECREVS